MFRLDAVELDQRAVTRSDGGGNVGVRCADAPFESTQLGSDHNRNEAHRLARWTP